jgi:hypothetical protein
MIGALQLEPRTESVSLRSHKKLMQLSDNIFLQLSAGIS